MRDVLRGVKVLEVAQWWFAPSAGAILAEWGAEVTKVEHPIHGDPIRGLSTTGAMPGIGGVNFMLEQCNRSKRSIGLDISKPEGREVLDQLISESDVFLTSFLPDVRRRLRLEVDDVRAANPQIIYARAHGAGDRGPERERGGYDAASFWARGGVVHHLTPPDVEVPISPRPSFGDGIGGLSLAGAVAAALFGRERHGEASVIDVSLLGTAMWVMSPDIVAASLVPGGLPSFSRDQMQNPLSNCYRTSDGRWVWLVMLQSDRFWPEMCEAMGRPELIADERFATAAARAENIGACMAELEETFASHTLAEWRTLLADVSGVWAAVQSSTDLLEDPQVLANGYLAEVGSGEERFRLVTSPAQFDAHAPTLTGAPEVGEHTDEILAELGRDWEQIIQLKIDGTVT